jgi:hypothetical protein
VKNKKEKGKNENSKPKKNRPCGDRTSDIKPTRQDMASMLTWWLLPDGYPAVTRQLQDGYPTLVNVREQSHTTRYIINYIKISFHWETFTKPFVCPNWNSARARAGEVKNKTETNKNKKNKNRPGGDRTSDIKPTRQDITSLLTSLDSPNWVSPAIIKYQENKRKNSRHWHPSNAATIGCLENNCNGKELCIFVIRALSKTTGGLMRSFELTILKKPSDPHWRQFWNLKMTIGTEFALRDAMY